MCVEFRCPTPLARCKWRALTSSRTMRGHSGSTRKLLKQQHKVSLYSPNSIRRNCRRLYDDVTQEVPRASGKTSEAQVKLTFNNDRGRPYLTRFFVNGRPARSCVAPIARGEGKSKVRRICLTAFPSCRNVSADRDLSRRVTASRDNVALSILLGQILCRTVRVRRGLPRPSRCLPVTGTVSLRYVDRHCLVGCLVGRRTWNRVSPG